MKELISRRQRIFRWLGSPASNGVVTASLAAVVGIIVLQLSRSEDAPDVTTLGLLAIAMGLAFTAFAPIQTSRFVRQITNFKFAGFEIGLAKVTEAERVSPPGSEGADGPIVERKSEGLQVVIEHLKSKLRFVRLITGIDAQVSRPDNYFDIAWTLRAERLMDDEEARFVIDLVSMAELPDAVLPSRAHEEFLDAAWSFAVRLGAAVWERYVRNGMRAQGWFIADFDQDKDHRRDFLAYRNDFWVVIAARVGEVSEPYYYGPTRKRLAALDLGVPLAGRCVVIPAGDRQATVIGDEGEGMDEGVKVLEYQGSLEEYPLRALEDREFNEDPRASV